MQADLLNGSALALKVEKIALNNTDGQDWAITTEKSPKPEKSPDPTLSGSKNLHMRFQVKAAKNAALTRAYFTRPNEEQPYYDLRDERYRNRSLPPYPLAATAKLVYDGIDSKCTR